MDGASQGEARAKTLRYVVEVADYLALMKRGRWREIELVYCLAAPLGFAFVAMLAGLALWLASQGTDAAGEDSLVWFAGIAALIGLGAGLFASGAYIVSYFEGLHYGSGEPVELTVSEAGLEERTDKGLTTFVPWGGVVSVSEGPDHLFLFLSRLYALIVPKRAFASPAEASAAAQWMAQRWQREAAARRGG